VQAQYWAGEGRGREAGTGGGRSTHLKSRRNLCFVKIYQRLSLAYADRQTDIQREDVAEFDTCPQWTECHSGIKLYFEAFRRVRAEIEVIVSNPFLKIILNFEVF
jgi:hypothetical protein